MGGTHVLSVDALVHSACSSVYFCASILCHLTNVSALSRNLLGYHLDGIIGHSSFSWSLHNYSLLSFISLFFLSYCLLSLHPFSLSLSLSPPVFEEGVGFKFLPGPSGLMQLNLAQRQNPRFIEIMGCVISRDFLDVCYGYIWQNCLITFFFFLLFLIENLVGVNNYK